MKKLFIALTVLVICILIAGCSKPAPTSPAVSPAAAPVATQVAASPAPAVTPTSTSTRPTVGAKYTWEEAVSHLGETATVTGPVIDSVDWKQLGVGNDIALGVGKSITDGSAFGVPLSMDRAKLPADLWKGKTVAVTGVIGKRAFGTGVNITVTDLSQIVVISAPTPAAQEAPSPGFEVTGTSEQTKQVQDSPPVTENGKMIFQNTTYQDYHGTLEGKIVAKFTMEVGIPSGIITMRGEGTFTGTVNGKQGSFTTKDTGSGQMVSLDSGVLTIEVNIVGGTGELINLRGTYLSNGTFGANVSKRTYSGKLSFEK